MLTGQMIKCTDMGTNFLLQINLKEAIQPNLPYISWGLFALIILTALWGYIYIARKRDSEKLRRTRFFPWQPDCSGGKG